MLWCLGGATPNCVLSESGGLPTAPPLTCSDFNAGGIVLLTDYARWGFARTVNISMKRDVKLFRPVSMFTTGGLQLVVEVDLWDDSSITGRYLPAGYRFVPRPRESSETVNSLLGMHDAHRRGETVVNPTWFP